MGLVWTTLPCGEVALPKAEGTILPLEAMNFSMKPLGAAVRGDNTPPEDWGATENAWWFRLFVERLRLRLRLLGGVGLLLRVNEEVVLEAGLSVLVVWWFTFDDPWVGDCFRDPWLEDSFEETALLDDCFKDPPLFDDDFVNTVLEEDRSSEAFFSEEDSFSEEVEFWLFWLWSFVGRVEVDFSIGMLEMSDTRGLWK